MNVATVAAPTVTHAAVDTATLDAKVTINDLNFFYGDARALKNISMSLYENKATACGRRWGRSTLPCSC